MACPPTDSKSVREAITCPMCTVEGTRTVLAEDHIWLRCTGSHSFCEEHTGAFVESAMAEPAELYPTLNKCPMNCGAGVALPSFERQLDAEQAGLFLTIMAAFEVPEGERIICCSEGGCRYFEQRTDRPVLFYCRSETCGKAHCRACHATVPVLEDAGDEEEAAEVAEAMEPHLTRCAELHEPHEAFQDALSEGERVRCPVCKKGGGRKDDACSHMLCNNCSTRWCYVCCKPLAEADGADAAGNNWGTHNADWATNPRRCPLFLSAICDVDDSWPSYDDADGDADDNADEACVAKLHKIRTLRLLRELHDKIGAPAFDALWARYGDVANCGYTKEEIRAVDMAAPRPYALET